MAPGELSPVEYFFANRDEASRSAAEFIAGRLRERLASADSAALVVSGGTSPVGCFDRLSRSSLRWAQVQVLLSDERWLPPDDDESNEKLVRTHLLKDNAADGRLLPVFAPGTTPAGRCADLDVLVRDVPRPFACTLLGMGSDGHFASLFPDAANLAAGLDAGNTQVYIPVTTAASPHPRISMTLAALSESDAILLLIFGAEKRDVYEAAAAGTSTVPAAALLRQEHAPVHVFWAP